jgi:phosphoribosyl 1,2-cyclic phosphate phosphodiesterase
MRIEVLGSGGAIATPRPFCDCRVCADARANGPPNARSGPSVFVHGPDVLVDTPEESRVQVAFSSIRHVAAGLYSHWHPDHTAGRRVWEAGFDFRAWPPEKKRTRTTPVYLPEQVGRDFDAYLGIREHFAFLEHLRVVTLHVVPDGESIELGGTRITPVRLAEDYVYAFLFEEPGRRALVAMDELNGWTPPDLGELDLAYLPVGIFEHHPLTGERAIDPDHRVLTLEATYPETLEIVRALGARRTVLSHVEHMDGLSHDDLLELGRRDGWEPAYDSMLIDVGDGGPLAN